MMGLAAYFFLVPPTGFDDSYGHRIAIPFILMACAFNILENLRTRAHIGQLVGALRSLMARSGKDATPQVRAEAVDILLESLKSDEPTVRATFVAQLQNLTGQQIGDDVDEWEIWWKSNRDRFRDGTP